MIKLKDGVAAVRSVLNSGGVTPAAQTNSHVELSSQSDSVEQRKEPEYDGEMPKSNALVSDRSRVLKEIAERRDAQAVADGNESVPVTGENGEEVEQNPGDSEITGTDLDETGAPIAPVVETPATPATPATPVVAAVPEETRTLIVNGTPMQVPLSKIIEQGTASFQKEINADLKLKQATELLEQAKRVVSDGNLPKGDAPAQSQENVSAIAKLTSAERVRIIRYGTDDEAAQVQQYMEEQAARPQVKTEDVLRAARESVGPQIAFEKGKEYVIAEYGDLLQDPDLGAIFLNRENAARASGDTRSHQELYKDIGEDMRTKFARPKPGSAGAAKPTPVPNASTAPVRTMEEKQAAKAAAPQLPRLASARLDGDANTPRPPTRAEMFANMRRARGFTQGKDL
jgi:hypothetical protein